jgi:hypothetical protein
MPTVGRDIKALNVDGGLSSRCKGKGLGVEGRSAELFEEVSKIDLKCRRQLAHPVEAGAVGRPRTA